RDLPTFLKEEDRFCDNLWLAVHVPVLWCDFLRLETSGKKRAMTQGLRAFFRVGSARRRAP
ncbi:MAG: hypothetical protein WBA90_14590, partial [Albidovulum sp.]